MMAPVRATRDRSSFGLALALTALATHALAMLVFVPRVLDDAARVIALVLLPGWAATRLLFARRRPSRFETAALIVGLGVALAVLVTLAARLARVHLETAGLTVAVLALVALAPRPGEPGEPDAPEPKSAPQRPGASAPAPAGAPARNARTRS